MDQTNTHTAKMLSLETSVPPYQLRQDDIRGVAAAIFDDSFSNFARLLPVYTNAAIETRYSCVPIEWYLRPAPLSERNTLYIENALLLLEQAAGKALSRAALTFDDIDGLIVVSSSGIATPSLDARLLDKLHLNRNMHRLPIFGLGCAGGVIGLARAAQLARSAPSKRYLYMVVELCGLTFLHSDRSKSNVIATALFGDGAAAAVISCEGDGPEIREESEYTWPDSLNVMGWDVVDEGLKAVFSQDIPKLVRRDMEELVDSFLAGCGLTKAEITAFLCHPGGAKVLDAIEDALKLPVHGLTHSRSVLRNYGNMSAATVMFVLEAALRNPLSGDYLLSAFGPGFTLALLLMHIP
jgi:alkylresorcinol/alkylpyrone synthase